MGKGNKHNQIKALMLKFGYYPALLLSAVMVVAEFNIGQFDNSSQVLNPWFQAVLILSGIFGLMSIYLIVISGSIPRRILYAACLLVYIGIGFLAYINVWFYGYTF